MPPPPDPSQQAPGLLARLTAHGAARQAGGALFAAGLVLAVAAASAWLLTPASLALRLPGPDALGRPAPATVRAPRDYEITDVEATARLRLEAAEAEPAVYDDDEGAAEEAVLRLRGAFRAAREALPGPRRPGERPRQAADVAALAAARAAFEARAGLPLRPEDLAALADAGFSEAVEQRLAALAAHVLTGMVVEDRDRILEEAERGIAARTLRGGVLQGERLVRDLALVRDLPSIRAGLRREAAGLPAAWPPALREAVVRVAGQLARPTLSVNLAESARRRHEAASRVRPVLVTVRRGERVVAEGERIERRHLVVFQGIQAQAGGQDVRTVRLGAFLLVALLAVLLWPRARPGGPRGDRRDAVLLSALLVGTVAMAAGGAAAADLLHDRFPALAPDDGVHLIPFAAGALVARALVSARAAMRLALAAGMVVGLLAGHSLFFALQAVLTGVAAAALPQRGRGWARLLQSGAAVGVVGAVSAEAAHLFAGRAPGEGLPAAALALLSGAVLLPLVAGAVLPLAERALGYLTERRLQALANLNHPALKDLIVQAPGTYHHAVLMGAMVEAAAPRVGADPLLARVCAYYHDLGKIRNPLYFAENQRGDNRHDQLAPSMSALIVKRHLADGLELARRWRLPQPVVDAMAQHHGTRPVAFFLARARKAAEAGEGPWASPADVDESLFRYPGPRPRTREAALVMLADVVEASVRAQADLGPGRAAPLARRRLDELVAEGELDDAPLTLRELRAAADAMAAALEAITRAKPGDVSSPPAEAGEPGPPAPPGPPGLHLVAKREA